MGDKLYGISSSPFDLHHSSSVSFSLSHPQPKWTLEAASEAASEDSVRKGRRLQLTID